MSAAQALTAQNPHWLVGNPSKLAQLSALWIGSVGVLALGLQPILLGALLNEARVTYDQLALMATLEILAIGVGSVLAAFVISDRGLRLKTTLVLTSVVALDLWTAIETSAAVLSAVRAITGLLEGGLVAIAVELIARSTRPGLYGGFFVSMQTIAQSLSALAFSQLVMPGAGSKGGFIGLAVITLVTLAAVLGMPKTYGKIPNSKDDQKTSPLTGKPLLSLLSILFFYMFLGSLWAFLEPIGRQSGIAVATVGLMVSVSLAVQVAGALSATLTVPLLDYPIPLAICSIIAIGVALVFSTAPTLKIFWLCTILIGVVWLYVVPFQIKLTVACDPSRKTALLVPAAQLFGAALGPVGATAFIRYDDFTPVAAFAAACAALSLFFVVILATIRRGSAAAASDY